VGPKKKKGKGNNSEGKSLFGERQFLVDLRGEKGEQVLEASINRCRGGGGIYRRCIVGGAFVSSRSNSRQKKKEEEK